MEDHPVPQSSSPLPSRENLPSSLLRKTPTNLRQDKEIVNQTGLGSPGRNNASFQLLRMLGTERFVCGLCLWLLGERCRWPPDTSLILQLKRTVFLGQNLTVPVNYKKWFMKITRNILKVIMIVTMKMMMGMKMMIRR